MNEKYKGDALLQKSYTVDFLKLLKALDGGLTEFSDSLWAGLADYATVYANGRMNFTFKNGETIDG